MNSVVDLFFIVYTCLYFIDFCLLCFSLSYSPSLVTFIFHRFRSPGKRVLSIYVLHKCLPLLSSHFIGVEAVFPSLSVFLPLFSPLLSLLSFSFAFFQLSLITLFIFRCSHVKECTFHDPNAYCTKGYNFSECQCRDGFVHSYAEDKCIPGMINF